MAVSRAAAPSTGAGFHAASGRCSGTGRWNAGLAALDRTVATLGEAPAILRIERIQLLLGAGRIDDARTTLIALSRDLEPDDPLRSQIDELLQMVGDGP